MPSGGRTTRKRRVRRHKNRRKLAAINAKILATGGTPFKTLTQYYRRPRAGNTPNTTPVAS